MSGIRVSEKHGVNPSIMQCFLCGGDKGIALLGRMQGDAEAPRKACYDKEPCDECKKHMSMGILIIGIDEALSKDPENPYRNGEISVLKREAAEEIFTNVFGANMAAATMKIGACFMSEDVMRKIGIPKPEEKSGGE